MAIRWYPVETRPVPERERDRQVAVPLVIPLLDPRERGQPSRFKAGRPGAIFASLRAFT
jgi:hypothetical protein